MEDETLGKSQDAPKDELAGQASTPSSHLAAYHEAVSHIKHARLNSQSHQAQLRRNVPPDLPNVSYPVTVTPGIVHSGPQAPADLATLSSTLKRSWPRSSNQAVHVSHRAQQDSKGASGSRARVPSQAVAQMPTPAYDLSSQQAHALGKTALKAILEPGSAPVQLHQHANNGGMPHSHPQTHATMQLQHQYPQPSQHHPAQSHANTQYHLPPSSVKAQLPAVSAANAFHQLNSPAAMFHPDVQAHMPIHAMQVQPNQPMAPFAFFPSDMSQLQQQQQQSAHLNAVLAAQFAMQNPGHVGTSPTPFVAGQPHLNVQPSLNPQPPSLSPLVNRTKRDREHSMRNLVKLPKQTRRHVDVKVEPTPLASHAVPAPANPHGLPLHPSSAAPMNVGSLAGLVPQMGSSVLLGKEMLMHSIPSYAGNILGTPPNAGNPTYGLQAGGSTSVKQRPDIAVNTRVYNKSKNQVSATPRRWTKEEDDLLRQAVKKHQEKNWKAISNDVPGRNHVQCLQRWRKALDPNVVKGHWTADEDHRLLMLVAENPKNWGHVARGIPGRTAKQCRERYHNHLDPSIKKGDWTEAEDTIIIERQQTLGNKWAEISKFLPGRTENSVKIRWKSIQRQAQGGYHSRRTKKSTNPRTETD